MFTRLLLFVFANFAFLLYDNGLSWVMFVMELVDGLMISRIYMLLVDVRMKFVMYVCG